MELKNILVTGAAGFIGYHLCKRLINLGHKVYGIDNLNKYYDIKLKCDRLKKLGITEGSWEFNYQRHKGNFTFSRVDICDEFALDDLFDDNNFDIVINLAAQAGVRYSLEKPKEYIQSNIVGFHNVLELCKKYKVDNFLYASSSSVYGKNDKIPFSTKDDVSNPVSLYAATKKSNELIAHSYSSLYRMNTMGMRFFTVYGPYGRPDMAPYIFTDAITKGKGIKVFNNGDMSRDFTYIDDIIDGIIICMNNNRLGYKVVNIGKGNSEKLMNL